MAVWSCLLDRSFTKMVIHYKGGRNQMKKIKDWTIVLVLWIIAILVIIMAFG